jgi:secondary thiamine-phosphate synthase enzyme
MYLISLRILSDMGDGGGNQGLAGIHFPSRDSPYSRKNRASVYDHPVSFSTLDVKTATREVLVDVTALVRQAIKQSGVTSGLAVLFCPHTTAGLTVQENADPDVRSDFIRHFAKMVPKDPAFQHDEGNADAHIKASLVGSSLTLIVEAGKPVLGRWQAIYFCEFDGPRDRQLHLKVIREPK